MFYDLTPDFRLAQNETKSLYSSAFQEQLKESRPTDLFTCPQPWDRPDIRLTALICQTYLLGNGIAQGDRLGMAASVELRLPLIDHRLVELAEHGLRKAHRDFDLPAKQWLKLAVNDIVPAWVYESS